MNPAAGDDGGAEAAGSDEEKIRASRMEVLTEAAEIYELHTIALYDLKGRLIQGIDRQPDHQFLYHLPGEAGHNDGNAGEGRGGDHSVCGGRLQI